MSDVFEEPLFREVNFTEKIAGNVIKAEDAELIGLAKISVQEESEDGVKVVLKKDENESVKEIKFMCSCGHTKTIVLDYSE